MSDHMWQGKRSQQTRYLKFVVNICLFLILVMIICIKIYQFVVQK